MQPTKPNPANLLFHLTRPYLLLAGILVYATGVGVSFYLGQHIDWVVYWLGQAWVTLMQISSHLLKSYFDHSDLALRRLQREKKNDGGIIPSFEIPRPLILQAAITPLTIVAVITVLLIARGGLHLQVEIILFFAFLLTFFYGVPPFRLVYSGYGELSQAIFVANIVPAFGFVLQTGVLHRILAMLTFPLTALFLAMALALSLRNYPIDLRFGLRSLLVRMGWQRGMNFHNILILFAYMFLVLATLLGLPWALTWPGLLTLPLGLAQIWQIIRIFNGAKPRWRLLDFGSVALFVITAYLIAFTLWKG
jgi:1,4-dihydroxy-2-naphthoate octaprenyltransferase